MGHEHWGSRISHTGRSQWKNNFLRTHGGSEYSAGFSFNQLISSFLSKIFGNEICQTQSQTARKWRYMYLCTLQHFTSFVISECINLIFFYTVNTALIVTLNQQSPAVNGHFKTNRNSFICYFKPDKQLLVPAVTVEFKFDHINYLNHYF